MILKTILDIIMGIVDLFFGFLPNIPQLPSDMLDSISSFFDLIFSNLSILGFLVRISTVKFLLPCVLAIIMIEHIYNLIMWIARKIPFLSIK